MLGYRLDDRLFFANASYVKGRVREALHGAPTPVRWLVFDAEALTHVDATGVDALKTLVNSLRQEAITFVFARVKDPTTTLAAPDQDRRSMPAASGPVAWPPLPWRRWWRSSAY